MSKRSKHGRGKHPHFRKKSKFRQMQPGAGVIQAGAGVMPPAAGDISRATAPVSAAPVVTAPAPQAPMPKKPAASAALSLRYEHIGGELKRIGILTGSIIVILIILYLFLK